MGRFVNDGEDFDTKSAFFHLEQAAHLGNKEALTNIAKIYLNMPRDILSSYEQPYSEDNENIAFDFIHEAAKKGDKSSILQIAKAFDTGNGLRNDLKQNWITAIEWYQELLKDCSDDNNNHDHGYSSDSSIDEPEYTIIGRIAEMYSLGGYGLRQDLNEAYDLYNEAGEKATTCGKGRIANKYYMCAEQIAADL